VKCEIGQIVIPAYRKRRYSVEKIRELAESIREIGLLQPIIITKDKVLISGLHRLEACRLLGWQEIDCIEKDYSELELELAEIDENLIRAELTTLERGGHLLRRKEIYEAKHPEAKAYSSEKQRQRRKQEPDEIISPGFTIDTAAKLGVTPRTVQQEVQIAEKIAPEVKEIISDTKLADSKKELLKLARMEPETQKKIAEKIVTGEAKGIVDARRLIKKDTVKETPQIEGKYRVIYADPPWAYNDKRDGNTTGAEDHYPSMTIKELCIIPVNELAEDNAVLFLWVTSPILEECFQVIKAWGFAYKTSFVWDKVKHNMGHYNSVRHEFLLICTKGSCLPDTPKLFDSVVTLERSVKHSEKPEEFREIIDILYPHGRRIELFARKRVNGWNVWGNEV